MNQTMPKGWYKYGGFEIIKGEKDSMGNNVGKVVSDDNGKFGFIMNRFPANYNGDTIELSGRVKYEKVKDYVGLIMWIDGEKRGHHLVFESMQNRHIRGSSDWTEYSIKVPYPPNSKYIYIGGILGKGGTAWFDDFRVTIDGKDIQTLEETKRLTLKDFTPEALTSALSKSSVPMDLSNQDTWNKSLDQLIDEVGDKKIVAIGESTHGTSEFYQVREMITKRLVEEKGFNLVVLESPYDDIELLNQSLDSKPLDSLMRKHLFSIYQTEEMRSFLQWYKEKRSDYSVEFKGNDDSYWAFIDLLKSQIYPINDPQLNQLLDRLDESIENRLSDNLKNRIKEGKKVYDNILAIENHLKSTGKLTGVLEEMILNGKTSYINYVLLDNEQPIRTRDEVMAERISYLAKQSDRKIIVWAHNAHISNEVIVDAEIGLMGYYLDKEFKDDYYAVGLMTLNGTYSYMDEKFINGDHNYNEELKAETLQSSEEELWETKLAKLGKAAIINTEMLSKELNSDAVIGPTKLIGYGKEDSMDIYYIPLTKHYDCLIFIENTNATRPIFN
ncbi:erythromycin esterase family protein [Algoriphagus pacificus]|uniref:Erythromycin esterase family protein n=1 Tax=Algoriphagus pacificus TaxID=2811234 RepID=A0ABS3CHR0_9BACT|nr:erythromycin esterase family protein [Algoriphagus pacificus]MBN7816643.1 erythromycin esterase family protein [Algoriphagus pacificus]